MTTDLTAIFNKNKTDKAKLGYDVFYEKHFAKIRKNKIKLLEIGVKHAAGAISYMEYFKNCKVFGMDNWLKINRPADVVDLCSKNNIDIFVGDQGNRKDLQSMVNKFGSFDIIIDDGSHMMSHQQISLGFLFNFLKPGGLYIIEDLLTSIMGFQKDRHKDFPVHLHDHEKISTLEVLKRLEINEPIISHFMTNKEISFLHENYQHCEVFQGTKTESDQVWYDPTIAVIYKAKNEKP
jgi:hypothetical protein